MPHSEYFCHAAVNPSQRRRLSSNTRKASLSVHAVAAKKWSRDGFCPAPARGTRALVQT